jgi:hypothetical protein
VSTGLGKYQADHSPVKKIVVVIGFGLVITGASAQAQISNGYVEIGGIYARYQETGGWFTSAVGNAKVGVNINDNISLGKVCITPATAGVEV